MVSRGGLEGCERAKDVERFKGSVKDDAVIYRSFFGSDCKKRIRSFGIVIRNEVLKRALVLRGAQLLISRGTSGALRGVARVE